MSEFLFPTSDQDFISEKKFVRHEKVHKGTKATLLRQTENKSETITHFRIRG